MAELSDLLPMPPQFGPPLPGSLKVTWPWLKKPPEREYVLPIVEAPELIVEPQKTETVLAAPAAVTPSSITYEIESPPEVSSAGMPTRISSDWIQV
ncbi:MAG: hypothetical protein ISS58_02900 [Dehalococcoidales bacterium]|nr:hypothetical protein [Dehalococcoidales bacterium]